MRRNVWKAEATVSGTTQERVGSALRARREELGLTQSRTAAAIGKTQTWLSYLEAGKRNPRLGDLELLLLALHMRLEIQPVERQKPQ